MISPYMYYFVRKWPMAAWWLTAMTLTEEITTEGADQGDMLHEAAIS